MRKSFMVVLILLAVSSAGLFAQEAEASKLNVIKSIVKDSDLIIPIKDVGSNATFYPVEIDGVRLEVIAVKTPDGAIRTAFNTCQVCYGSGRGFYKQVGDLLQCQNCGNRFRMSQVEKQSGGCNPVPITPQNKTVSDTSITIPKTYLSSAKKIFASWKRI
ncbi:MAG: hypothetical protein Ta2G_02330 [Termitinemataceae bacterium]|nr:MAG: hypothetical protein Ta2G_02330 [Termitinemataceae bacterium]